jgi:bacterioferritin-associated ferredoxin
VRPKKKAEIICRCNNISRETIETAIRAGCQTMNEIFDDTTAGVGPCGGSCRRKLLPMLELYLAEGTFPEKFAPTPPLADPKKEDPVQE